MNTLRARFAAVLLASVLCVVGLATLTTTLVLHHVGLNGMAVSVAREVEFGVAAALAPGARLPLAAAPPLGRVDARFGDEVAAALGGAGASRPVVVVRRPPPEGSVVSVGLAPDRWLDLPIPPDGPPPEAWTALAAWSSLIVLGTGVVALLASHRLTRPLALLDAVAAGVGPDGVMARVPETGPAEVRAAARSLNRMGDALRSAMESRMRLVAAAGHDLRTPITRMRLRTEFLDEADQPRWVADLEELERIADEAIDLVREEAGVTAPEVLELGALACDVCADLAAMGLPVTVVDVARCHVEVPRLALTRAVRNLVSNAATHGGRAEVSTAVDRDRAVLTVTDRGPGIPDHLMERVFEPFFRADPARRQTVRGAGLGLAIAHGIVSRSGGTLTLANRRSGGLRQTASFPCATSLRRVQQRSDTRFYNSRLE